MVCASIVGSWPHSWQVRGFDSILSVKVGGDAGTCAARLYFRLFQRQAGQEMRMLCSSSSSLEDLQGIRFLPVDVPNSRKGLAKALGRLGLSRRTEETIS